MELLTWGVFDTSIELMLLEELPAMEELDLNEVLMAQETPEDIGVLDAMKWFEVIDELEAIERKGLEFRDAPEVMEENAEEEVEETDAIEIELKENLETLEELDAIEELDTMEDMDEIGDLGGIEELDATGEEEFREKLELET